MVAGKEETAGYRRIILYSAVFICYDILACLKIHSRHLHAPLSGIFALNSGFVARCAPFIRDKSPTKCDVQLPESNFKTCFRRYK
ncbi:DUF6783 domain-containing protein [uncultured Robinsoniella sp.]|uniref:DUF6783 domain-containing protein n=1 Tax=uncultured Robinsoniella sp. TaxID=904190 RepID=UPI00374FBAB0